MAKVNEKLLLEKGGPAGVAKCADITTLDLSAMQIKDVDTSLFNQLVKLEDLNLSQNRISTFPSDLILPKLKRLDLSDNTISQLHFLKNFPHLESVLLTANPLQVSDKYLAVHLLPNLSSLESIDLSAVRHRIASLESDVKTEINKLWEKTRSF